MPDGGYQSLHRRVAVAVCLASAVVLLVHVGAVGARLVWQPEPGPVRDLLVSLDAGNERSLAAWWTSLVLALGAAGSLGAAALCTGRADLPRGTTTAWRLLAALLALLSLDETISLHERGADLTAAAFATGSPWRVLGWTLPGLVVLLVSLPVLVRLLRLLPPVSRRLVAAGLATSVVAAVGLELVATWLLERGAELRWVYVAVTVEEALELAGVTAVLLGVLVAATVECVGDGVVVRYAALPVQTPGAG